VGVFGSTVTQVFLNLTEVLLTLTEVFPCFFLSCKANARVKLAKTGHGSHSSTLVCICVVRLSLFVLLGCYLCCSMYCLCVNVYCHRVTTQLQLIINIILYIYIYIKLLKNPSVGAELFRADGRTDRHDEANITLFKILRPSLKCIVQNQYRLAWSGLI